MSEVSPGAAAYLGTARVPDPENHRIYNEWHQLDHRPENLALEEVAWGERWVRSPRCAATSLVAVGAWSDFDYLNNYWLRGPVDQSIDRWTRLADDSFHWGRRPDLGVTERSFLSFFRPVLGAAASRVMVPPNVLPLRPNTGVYLTVTELTPTAGPERVVLEERFGWYRTVGFPEMISRPGIAGVWALVSAHDLAPESWAAQEATDPGAMPNLRAHLYYLDDDPYEVATRITIEDVLAPGSDRFEKLLFAGPLESITPWQWDWFD